MKSFQFRIKHLFFLLILLLLSACGSQNPTEIPPTPSQKASVTNTPVAGQDNEQSILEGTSLDLVPTLAQAVPTRTPEPTPTPDALAEEISQIVQDTGLSGKTLLWLGYADWFNLGISLLYVLVGYLIGTWLIRRLLPRLVIRTKTKLDDSLLQISGNELRWLVVIVILRFAIRRLNFVNPDVKSLATDIIFFLMMFLVGKLFWSLINLAAKQADDRASKAGHQKEAESLIKLSVWGMRLVLMAIGAALTLSHFGINITGFAFILGVVVLVLSLAGRDILTDIVSGAMILIDRPYRIGDRIDLPSIDSWGDVVDIGMRSTKIKVVDDRTVIIPNSQIAKNQVINYNLPDSSYNNTIYVFVAYENDPDLVAKILEETTRSVNNIQTDREITVWLHELNESYISYRLSWWVANYTQRYPIQDQVSRAIIRALKDAGVVMPYQKGSLNIQMDAPLPKPPSPQENPSD